MTHSNNQLVAEDKKFDPKAVIKAGYRRALEAQYPLAVANVKRLRRAHPDKSHAELISDLNKWYLGTVTTTGASAGAGADAVAAAAAFFPNGLVQVFVALGEMISFLEALVFYTLSVAEIHGLHVDDVERRAFLVTTALLGSSAATITLDPLIDRAAPYWGKKVVESIPMSVISRANKVLGPRFATKWGTKQGVLVLGKQAHPT